MEWAVLGYTGPTVLVIKTTSNAILGASAEAPWKEANHFYGGSAGFLFQLCPALKVFRPMGRDSHFMYLHTDFTGSKLDVDVNGRPHGLGFGGDMKKPRLFIPESFEQCSADFLDKTFQPGELVPPEDLEKFEIKCLEVWGVGGDETIRKALGDRADHRELTKSTLEQARVVHDRSAFAKDMQSGLIPGKIFDHNEHVRGRQEFRVDDKHGGYKLDH